MAAMTELSALQSAIEAPHTEGEGENLFVKLARLRNAAEAAGEGEVLAALDELRPKLRRQLSRPSLAAKVHMVWRLLLTLIVTIWGCMALLLFTPLRLTHPLLRPLGVPNGLLPLDVLELAWAHLVLRAAGVRVRVEGEGAGRWSGIPHGVIVYNHASNLDPFILFVACGGHRAPKFVGKKVLFAVPIFGWMSLALGQVPINRGDPKKSIATMNERVAAIMSRWSRSVAVSPEGTRTKDGHLVLPFKKGVFHLSQQMQAPILPLAIHGAFDLWPPSRLFTGVGEITVRALEAQPPLPPLPEAEAHTSGTAATDEARMRLQRTYVDHFSKQRDKPAPYTFGHMAEDALYVGVAVVAFAALKSGCWLLLAAAGFSTESLAVLFAITTVSITFLVHHYL